MTEQSTTRHVEKANMLLLSKEISDKDRSMKTQLLLSSPSKGEDKLSGEKVWEEYGYFEEVKPEMNIEKVNIPENTLFYINQGFISTVKNGELAMYVHNFIIGQLIVAANQPANINEYSCNENEVKLLSCVYDLESGFFKGLRLMLAYIVLRGDDDEVFFSYGFNKNKSKVLYSYSKQQIPDTFVTTSFKKHFQEVVNEKKDEKFSKMFYYLPSISDRKEEINQYKDNVSLTPMDVSLDFISSFSDEKSLVFQPQLLNCKDKKIREPIVKVCRALFRHIANYSNQNLERNVTYLNLKSNRDSSEMEWTTGRFDCSKFKLTY